MYPDMHRFKSQLSALLMLRHGDGRTAGRQHSTTVHDVHWKSCAQYRPSAVSEINVAVDEEHFDRVHAAGRRRAVNLTIGPGDLYVFNSNFLHQVLPAKPGPGRIVLGAFLGIDDKRQHLWA